MNQSSLGQSSPYPYSPYSNDRSVGYSTRRGDQDHCLLPTFITTAIVTTKKRTDRYRYIDIDIEGVTSKSFLCFF